jgi:hypothetical protein
MQGKAYLATCSFTRRADSRGASVRLADNELAAMLLLCSLLGVLLVAPPQTASTAAIDVLIVDDTGAVVPGAEVFVEGARRSGARSGADGRARVDGLPPGAYTLFAEKPGYDWRAWGLEDGSPVPIALGAGQRFDATLTLPRAGSITGLVLDEFGKPARALVRVQRSSAAGQLVRTTQSDGDGTYRVDELPAGEYVVGALGASAAFTGRDEDVKKPVYVPVFFPNTTMFAAAARVAVRPGVPSGGVDLQLQRVLPARVDGVVLDPQGQPAAGATIQLQHQDDRSALVTLRTSAAGTFASTLMPGAWALTADGGATQELMATPGATTTLTVALQQPARIAGRLLVAGPAPPAQSLEAVVVELEPRAPAGRAAAAVPLRVPDPAAQAFVAEKVAAGEYRVKLPSGLDTWVIETVSLGGRELVDAVLRAAPGEEIRDLVVTIAAPAEISGRVVDRAGAPVYRHQIVIIPADRASRTPGAPRIRWAQPDTNGRFAVQGLPAGEYLLAAMEGVPASGIDAALIEAAAASALKLSVPRGGRVVQDVMVAR